MDPSDEFKAQQQAIHAALVGVNRTVNSITAEDLTFLRTVNPGVATQLDDQAARLLRLSNGLLAAAATTTGRRAPPVLEDADDVELQWKGVVDVIDGLLEKADTTLDEYTGMLKRKDAPTAEGGPESKKAKQQQQQQQPPPPGSDRLDWSLRRANIAKPQDLFERKVDNRADAGPWKPLLTTKPHAVVPLAASLTTFVDEHNRTQYRHPYETEITQMQYPASVFQAREPIRFQPPEASEAVWVDTFDGVLAMLDELRAADEIAVDLEHHDFRTYTGLLSLMQISTRSKDWIVDTLQPWRHKLEVLNEVFADPAKLKVFHGANSDIVWLQRDLGLYIVGLFDTYFASERLAYGRRSLAFLLDRFVHFDADKKYQMADWRIRPLTAEMLYYARSDTHYLLYIYDMVRNELLAQSAAAQGTDAETNDMAYVLQKSKEVSLLRFEPLVADPETGHGARGWLSGLLRAYTAMSGEQFAVYRALFAWRDDLARKLDESPAYLMPMRILSDIARILPPDHKALWSLLTPTPRATKACMEELFGIIQAARVRGADGPTSLEYLRSDAVTAAGPRAHEAYAARTALAAAASSAAAVRSKNVADLPDVGELRSDFSQLWGPASRIRSERATAAAAAAASETVDAPWFVQAAIASTAGGVPAAAAAAAAATSAAAPTEEYIALPPSATKATSPSPARQDNATPTKAQPEAAEAPAADKADKDDKDEAFTLKWGKGGQKPAGGAAGAGKAKADKAEKKSQKKKDKAGRAKRPDAAGSATGTSTSDSDGGAPIHGDDGEGEGDGGDADADEDFVPFNYDTAGSVLNPKTERPRPGGGGGKEAGGKKKKAFNPYGDKGGDYGPKAARRMHFEKNGKTGTFKK